MSRTELKRLIADAGLDGALRAAAREAGETAEGLVAFARGRGYDVTLADLPAAARGVRGNAVGGPGGATVDRWGFWGSRNAPRPLTTDRF